MSLVEWLTLALVCTLGAVSPGPSLLVVINQALNGSRLHGVLTAISHGAMVGGWALLTVVGLSQLLSALPWMEVLLTVVAVLYLLNMSRGAWQSGTMKIDPEQRAKTTYWQAVRDGAVIATFNPKLMLFFIAIFSPFVGSDADFATQSLLVVTPWVTDTSWYIIVSLLLSSRKSLDLLQRNERQVNRGMAIALVLLAAVMVYGGLQ